MMLVLGYLLPILLILAPLLLGRYPGERLLARTSPRVDAPRREAHSVPSPPLRIQAPRGGRLIAYRFGGRAPPLQPLGT